MYLYPKDWLEPTAWHGVDRRRQLSRNVRPDAQGQPSFDILGEGGVDGFLRQEKASRDRYNHRVFWVELVSLTQKLLWSRELHRHTLSHQVAMS